MPTKPKRTPKKFKKQRASTSNTVKELFKPEPGSIAAQMIAAQMIPASIHSHLRFGSGLPHSNEYYQRLSGLVKKQFDSPWVVDWDPLVEVRRDEWVKDQLRQQYSPTTDGGKTYLYEDWERLINKNQPIYQELCWEFYSTYFLKEEPDGIKDKEFMRFRLGGVNRQMSLEDFTRCLKIYSEEQMGEQHFNDYIWSGARVSAMYREDFNPNKVWEDFSSVASWSPGGVSYLYMDSVVLRLIHLFLSLNIFHRSEYTDRVNLSDLWYLEQIRSKTHVNIPYCVAYYLKHVAANNSRICGGHFVTLIADHLRVARRASTGIKKLTLETSSIDIVLYQAAKAVVMSCGKIFHSCILEPARKRFLQPRLRPSSKEQQAEEDERVIHQAIHLSFDRIVKRQLQLEETVMAMIQELNFYQEQTLRVYYDDLSLRLAIVELQLSSSFDSRTGVMQSDCNNVCEPSRQGTWAPRPRSQPQPQQSGKEQQPEEEKDQCHRQTYTYYIMDRIVKRHLQLEKTLMAMIEEHHLRQELTLKARIDDLSSRLACIELQLSMDTH